MNKTTDRTEFCLKADSCCQQSRMPLSEFLEAAITLVTPVSPGFTLNIPLAVMPVSIVRTSGGSFSLQSGQLDRVQILNHIHEDYLHLIAKNEPATFFLCFANWYYA